jgi:aconitate hydratase
MAGASNDIFGARTLLGGVGEPVYLYRLDALEKRGVGNISRLPFSIKVLLEALLRQVDGFAVTQADVARLADWNAASPAAVELPFKPARVILQDFTGVPAVVDLAAMRSAMAARGRRSEARQPADPG